MTWESRNYHHQDHSQQNRNRTTATDYRPYENLKAGAEALAPAAASSSNENHRSYNLQQQYDQHPTTTTNLQMDKEKFKQSLEKLYSSQSRPETPSAASNNYQYSSQHQHQQSSNFHQPPLQQSSSNSFDYYDYRPEFLGDNYGPGQQDQSQQTFQRPGRYKKGHQNGLRRTGSIRSIKKWMTRLVRPTNNNNNTNPNDPRRSESECGDYPDMSLPKATSEFGISRSARTGEYYNNQHHQHQHQLPSSQSFQPTDDYHGHGHHQHQSSRTTNNNNSNNPAFDSLPRRPTSATPISNYQHQQQQQEQPITQQNPSSSDSVFHQQDQHQHHYQQHQPAPDSGMETPGSENTSQHTLCPRPKTPLQFKKHLSQLTPCLQGIANHGNTCYINSIIQALVNSDRLAEYLVLEMYHQHLDAQDLEQIKNSKRFGTAGGLTRELADFMRKLWLGEYDSKTSRNFKSFLGRFSADYKSSSQQDAQEFLMWILDKLHEDLNMATDRKFKSKTKGGGYASEDELAGESLSAHRKAHCSFITYLFEAQFRSSISCHSCFKSKLNFEPYMCVSLPVPQSTTKPLFVTLVFHNRVPRQLCLGLNADVTATLREVKECLAKEAKIPFDQLVLLELSERGIDPMLSDDTDIATLGAGKMIHAIELPSVGPQLVSAIIANAHASNGARIGGPYAIGISRDATYEDIRRRILLSMADSALRHGLHPFDVPLDAFQIRVADEFSTEEVYLNSKDTMPLYTQEMERILTVPNTPLRVILVWNTDRYLRVDEEPVFNHASAHELRTELKEKPRHPLKDSFSDFMQKEFIEWSCSNCKRFQEQAEKSIFFWSLPDLLIIHLKRFKQLESGQQVKLDPVIDFPIRGLDLSPFVCPPSTSNPTTPNLNVGKDGLRKRNGLIGGSHRTNQQLPDSAGTSNNSNNNNNTLPSNANKPSFWKSKRKGKYSPDHNNPHNNHNNQQPPQQNQSTNYDAARALDIDTDSWKHVYDLYAVVDHHGDSLNSGHYTASCRNPVDETWRLFDDLSVTPIQPHQLVTQSAYLLFYERRIGQIRSNGASNNGNNNHYNNSPESGIGEHWIYKLLSTMNPLDTEQSPGKSAVAQPPQNIDNHQQYNDIRTKTTKLPSSSSNNRPQSVHLDQFVPGPSSTANQPSSASTMLNKMGSRSMDPIRIEEKQSSTSTSKSGAALNHQYGKMSVEEEEEDKKKKHYGGERRRRRRGGKEEEKEEEDEQNGPPPLPPPRDYPNFQHKGSDHHRTTNNQLEDSSYLNWKPPGSSTTTTNNKKKTTAGGGRSSSSTGSSRRMTHKEGSTALNGHKKLDETSSNESTTTTTTTATNHKGTNSRHSSSGNNNNRPLYSSSRRQSSSSSSSSKTTTRKYSTSYDLENGKVTNLNYRLPPPPTTGSRGSDKQPIFTNDSTTRPDNKTNLPIVSNSRRGPISKSKFSATSSYSQQQQQQPQEEPGSNTGVIMGGGNGTTFNTKPKDHSYINFQPFNSNKKVSNNNNNKYEATSALDHSTATNTTSYSTKYANQVKTCSAIETDL